MAKVPSLHAWGAHLARLRQNAALSGAEVVVHLAALGVRMDRRSIYAYEGGRIAAPDSGAVWGLSKIYGVNTDDLISLLVQARTGQRLTATHEGTTGQESIRVSPEEREIVHQLRGLSSKARQACRDFIAFEAQRASARGHRRERSK
jgi:hypothetical protein